MRYGLSYLRGAIRWPITISAPEAGTGQCQPTEEPATDAAHRSRSLADWPAVVRNRHPRRSADFRIFPMTPTIATWSSSHP